VDLANAYRFYDIAGFKLMDYVHTFYNSSKKGEFAIQMHGRTVRDKKLLALGMSADGSHADEAFFFKIRRRCLGAETFIEAAISITPVTSSLHHKIGLHPVEYFIIVIPVSGQTYKLTQGAWGGIPEQPNFYVTPISLDFGYSAVRYGRK
jgi:hypothetical protein